MVRKNLWDRHEQAVLLVALQEVLYNNCDREKMIVDISRQLRQRAIANGDKIDDKFRNETGIRLQMLSLEHIFTNGKSGINKPNKWNSEIIHIYRDDWPYFQYICFFCHYCPLLYGCPRRPPGEKTLPLFGPDDVPRGYGGVQLFSLLSGPPRGPYFTRLRLWPEYDLCRRLGR